MNLRTTGSSATMPPAVSIIIPTYNRTTWLKEAIQSALDQSHPAIEIVVVDDGSDTSEAKHIAKSFPHVQYIRQSNLGSGAARNLGIATSKGDFLLFLDDDDWLTEDAVSEKLECLRQNPGCGAAYSDLLLITHDGLPIAQYYAHRKYSPPSGDIYPDLLPRNFIPLHAILWQRSILVNVGGFPAWSGAEDWLLLLRASERTKFIYIPEVHGAYRLHDRNITRMVTQQTRGYTAVQEEMLRSPRFHALPRSYRAKILCHYAVVQLMTGDPSLGRSYLSTARKLAPGNLQTMVLHIAASLGQVPFQTMIKTFRRVRYWLQPAPSSTSIFLSHE